MTGAVRIGRLCLGLALVACCTCALAAESATTPAAATGGAATGLAPIRKVAVFVAPAADGSLSQLAESLGACVVEVLGQSAGVTVSSVRPNADLAAAARGLCAGELGQRIATATEADAVLLINLAEETTPARVLIASLAAYDARRREIDLPPTLRATVDDAGASSTLERSVAGLWARWLRLAAYPTAEVLDVRVDTPRLQVTARVDGPLPTNAGGYDAERLGPSLVSPTTGERFVAEGRPLGRAVLTSAEGDTISLTLGDRIPLAPGARLRLLPADGALPRGEGSPLIVTSRPWSALVTVEGEVRALTPARLTLPAGDREIGANHPLALPWRRVVSAAERGAGLFTVPLQLVQTAVATPAASATVRVESDPAGAEVLVNGETRGRTPLDLPNLTGRVEVAVRRDGYKPWATAITVTAPMNLKATLEPLAGTLRVLTEPSGAKVLLNGKEYGVTPLDLTAVPPGEHEVVVVPVGGQPTARRVVLRPGETAKVDFSVAPVDAVGPGSATGPAAPTTPVAPVAPTTPTTPAVREAPSQTLVFAVKEITWQHKLPLGKDAGLHVVLAKLTNGHEAFSVVLGPSRPSLLSALPDGLAIDFPGVKGLSKPEAWEVPKHPQVVGVALEPLSGPKGGFRVRLVLKPGAVARMHETSTPDRLRFILETKAPAP